MIRYSLFKMVFNGKSGKDIVYISTNITLIMTTN